MKSTRYFALAVVLVMLMALPACSDNPMPISESITVLMGIFGMVYHQRRGLWQSEFGNTSAKVFTYKVVFDYWDYAT